jgi:diguanylate cyclase (GGDEF)-like protein
MIGKDSVSAGNGMFSRGHAMAAGNKESNHFRQVSIVGVTVFVAATIVIALADLALQRGLEPIWLAMQAIVLAGVAAVAAALSRRRIGSSAATDRPPADGATRARTELDRITRTLNEHGITVKLLELMALGERYGNKLAIAVADVDYLCLINERYGNDMGDRALRSIATVLNDTIRMPDRLGRNGDDQFLILLPETDIHGARQIGERLREAIAQVEIDADQGDLVRLTASIGVTAYRRGDDLNNLLSRATRAMRQAKVMGRNRVLTDLAA